MRISDWSSDVCSSDLAIRHADLPGPFRLIGESAAGHPFTGSVGAGETVRISTGAALPAGADTVFIQEEARSEEHTSELQSLMRISYDVFCLKKTTNTT